jgi:CheY-like chemotaxis protein
MQGTQIITLYIPGLRRFARALAGSQDRGDAQVIALLEALVANSAKLQENCAPKIALYRLFIRLWNSAETNAVPEFGRNASGPLRKLQSLTPMPRQALLLLALEGFEPSEIAEILECSAADVARLINRADLEIEIQLKPAKILIIEDEALIALHLEELVKGLGHKVTGLARTQDEALALVKEHKPQLILSDIQLADGSSGLDAVNEILASFEVPVIFVTGHSELLLTGTKPEPVFLIEKPFDAATVKAVISQALFFEVRSRMGAAAEVSAGTSSAHASAA